MEPAYPRVLFLSRTDFGGGAEQFALNFALRYPGSVAFYCKYKELDLPLVKQYPSHLTDYFWKFMNSLAYRVFGLKHDVKTKLGLTESCNFLYSRIKNLEAYKNADIIFITNIHSNYLDFSSLRKIAKEKKIVLPINDMWLYTGGEAYVPDNLIDKVHIPVFDKRLPPLNNPWVDRRKSNFKAKRRFFSEFSKKLFLFSNSNYMRSIFYKTALADEVPHHQTIIAGVETDIFIDHDKRDWQKPRILWYNTKNPYKNNQLCSQTLSNLQVDCDLYVIGDDVSSHLNNAHITVNYLGPSIANKRQLSEIYNSVDILVFPSLYEAFGLMVAEAKSCGVCVVSGAIGGISEQLDNGSGVLVSPLNFDNLHAALTKCCSELEETRRIGKTGVADVQQRFAFERFERQLADYLVTINAL
jgi:glycosyltransferase involved in cell wall biosynthesis